MPSSAGAHCANAAAIATAIATANALRRRSVFCAIALAWLVLLPGARADAQDRGARLPTVELNAGIHLIHAELAATESARVLGLMYRDQLAPNHGMLFVFDERAPHCMWMRNTPLALSVAFLDDDGSIANVEEMKPATDTTHCARHPVRYALEMEAQWFSRHGLQAGGRLQGISGVAPAR